LIKKKNKKNRTEKKRRNIFKPVESKSKFKSKRVSGLSIMCNATAHKISVLRGATKNYKIVYRWQGGIGGIQYPFESDLFSVFFLLFAYLCLDQVPPSDP